MMSTQKAYYPRFNYIQRTSIPHPSPPVVVVSELDWGQNPQCKVLLHRLLALCLCVCVCVCVCARARARASA